MSNKKPVKKSRQPADNKATRAPSSSPMNVDLLEQIISLMDQSGLTTVDVRDGDKRVILKRGGEPMQVSHAAHHPVPHAPSVVFPHSPSTALGTPENSDPDAGLIAIKSPMVGTFYSASGPDAKPFVSVGTTVDDDTDVCIIEAMKVFNNIKAETRGTVTKVMVTNGQTVEFGQPLFMVKP